MRSFPVLLGFSVVGCLGHSEAEPGKRVLLDVPPRFMWGWSPPSTAVGYCGSMSLQSVGLYYGNWITQDAARGTNGNHTAQAELLLPGSESHALKVLKFNYTPWDDWRQEQHTAFLKWSREAIDAGDPVIFGVYMRTLNDADYDHIVPMVGYDSTGIFFNDLHANHTLRYSVTDFVQSREGCVGNCSFDYCLPAFTDYGIRVHGNVDTDNVLLPVQLKMESWLEPDYSKEDMHHEEPTELKATLIITHLQPGVSYVLLHYDDAAAVPKDRFLDSQFSSRKDFVASGTKAEFSTSFMSNSTQFFRCIRNSRVSDARWPIL